MHNTLEYKGYYGKFDFDPESCMYHGRLINMRDVVTFEGHTVVEMKEDFCNAVTDYLESLGNEVLS